MRCWYTRWQMSNALDRGDLASLRPGLRRGHLADCASCQAFGRSLEALHAGLLLGASSAAAPVRQPRARRRLLLAGPVAVGAAAAVVIVIGIRSAPLEPPVAPLSPSELPVAETLVRVREVTDRVAKAVTRTPLDTELENLILDSKRGIAAVLATGGLR